MESLEDIRDLLGQVEPTDRLEWLVAKGDCLPELDPQYHSLRDSGVYAISECLAPVFFMVSIEDGNFRIVGDVPKEAPTARGFVGFLYSQFDGSQILDLPDDILNHLHLDHCISFQRKRGLTAIYDRLKRAQFV